MAGPRDGEGGHVGRAVEVGLDISIAEPNEPQRIAAPKVSVPLQGLLSRLGITVDELETALSGGSAGSRRSDGKASYRSCLRGAADAKGRAASSSSSS